VKNHRQPDEKEGYGDYTDAEVRRNSDGEIVMREELEHGVPVVNQGYHERPDGVVQETCGQRGQTHGAKGSILHAIRTDGSVR